MPAGVPSHPDPRQLLEAFEAFTAASEHLQTRYEALQAQLASARLRSSPSCCRRCS